MATTAAESRSAAKSNLESEPLGGNVELMVVGDTGENRERQALLCTYIANAYPSECMFNSPFQFNTVVHTDASFAVWSCFPISVYTQMYQLFLTIILHLSD